MVYLDKNGVTIKADKKAKVGQEYALNGVSYLVVDDRLLIDMINENKNVTKVVTTRIKNMTHFFNPMYNNYVSLPENIPLIVVTLLTSQDDIS